MAGVLVEKSSPCCQCRGVSPFPHAPYHGKRSDVRLHVVLLEASTMSQKLIETTGLRP